MRAEETTALVMKSCSIRNTAQRVSLNPTNFLRYRLKASPCVNHRCLVSGDCASAISYGRVRLLHTSGRVERVTMQATPF